MPICYGEERDWVGMRESGRGGGGRGSVPHRKITRCRPMGRSRSQPPPAPDEISWFRPWGGGGGGGGGGGQFHWNALEQIA